MECGLVDDLTICSVLAIAPRIPSLPGANSKEFRRVRNLNTYETGFPQQPGFYTQ